ncbi:MAG TPA: TCP-1/cpn60 chaperonin family protein, partial [Candidatus Eisenbacteria bacterium]
MGKRVRFDDDARRALWRGIDQLASAVRITLGPRGRSVVLDRTHGSMPSITRDGIAIAQELELPDPFENMGVQMLREVALRTGQAAGDGTSTATVIAHRIVGDGFAAVSAGGNPVALRRGIDAAVAA